MPDVNHLEKVLTANDVGSNRSHQAGFTVPRSMVPFFPHLDPRVRNPDCWLTVTTDDGHTESWRFVYYNKKLFGEGTRNEYRVTHCRPYFARTAAAEGDTLALKVDRVRETVEVSLQPQSPSRPEGERLVLSSAGRWRHLEL